MQGISDVITSIKEISQDVDAALIDSSMIFWKYEYVKLLNSSKKMFHQNVMEI